MALKNILITVREGRNSGVLSINNLCPLLLPNISEQKVPSELFSEENNQVHEIYIRKSGKEMGPHTLQSDLFAEFRFS